MPTAFCRPLKASQSRARVSVLTRRSELWLNKHPGVSQILLGRYSELPVYHSNLCIAAKYEVWQPWETVGH